VGAKMYKRAISIILTICFLSTNIAYALPARSIFNAKSHATRHCEDQKRDKKEDLLKISIPNGTGSVADSFNGKKPGLVIHIQDCHADELAQKNISSIISHAVDKHDVNTLCVEAASKKLDTSFYDKYEDTPHKKKVVDVFLKEGLFTGAEHFLINNKDKNILAFGVEDKNLYLKHYNSYKENIKRKEDAIKWINNLFYVAENCDTPQFLDQ